MKNGICPVTKKECVSGIPCTDDVCSYQEIEKHQPLQFKAEQIYTAIGDGYGFNGSKQEGIAVVHKILSEKIKTGIELIADERHEQIYKHGRSVILDVMENDDCELSQGAKELLLHPFCVYQEADLEMMPEKWDKDICRKMMLKPYKERLIIAGALIAAEIDRLLVLSHINSAPKNESI